MNLHKSMPLTGLVCLIAVFGLIVRAEALSDHIIQYRYGTTFKEPSVDNGADIEKHILNFTHFNTDLWGSNFFTIDTLLSAHNDPDEEGVDGATEVYGIYRRTFKLEKMLNRNLDYPNFIRDITLYGGVDLNTKDTRFAPQKRLLVVGPQLQLAIPNGYTNIAFNYSKEWNYNGISRRDVTFEGAFELETQWGVPFYLGETKWNFTGFFNYIAPKGKDGFGVETKYEILARPQLLLDVGHFYGKDNVLEVGVGYEYWLNKFGNDHDRVPGSLAKVAMVIVKAHF